MNLIPRGNFFELDKFFDDFWSPGVRENTQPGFFAPRVDVKELDDHYEITAELPGVTKDDIHVHVENGILTLEAETTREDREEKAGKVIRQERRYGKFMRSFNIGTDIREDDISAAFNDGVLTLRAPKHVEEAPQPRRIQVQ
ncbi:MAG: Hsp20/alpha crystallin family protein [bacterium]